MQKFVYFAADLVELKNETAPYLILPDNVLDRVTNSFGKKYKDIAKLPPEKLAGDALNEERAHAQAKILEKYVELQNKKVLEIGSGLGINILAWSKKNNIDGYGIEPSGDDFQDSLQISKQIAVANGLNPEKLLHGFGEKIPFNDNSFDIVYSANVLEHVTKPAEVLHEAMRVLKPGGTMQIVFPNYHSYFEGHYNIFHPPILSNKMLRCIVKYIYRRDPAYVKTLRTNLNVWWTKRQIKKLKTQYSFDVLTLGKDIFSQRMKNIDVKDFAGLGKLRPILKVLLKLKINSLVAGLIIFFRGWTPIIITLRKHE